MSNMQCPNPRCNGFLVERVNKKTGSLFFGCSNFPKCRETKPGEEEDERPDAFRSHHKNKDGDYE